ncbi:protein FAR1-RELATED SEQUENCE 5-like [Diospyros lotus]|uniref:protein FAR1-RELATED SEQUENCE 5-like n=1 Tax=Diospyros lotus TaxID=55363 RepID=UPI0022509C79|nr:protein FAR1-RELATED SEQUENCE 5-like [Diospyros lotus]
MIFNSIESLMNAYQEHVRVLGFVVAKRSAHKKSGKSYKYVTICCDRGRKQQFEKSTKRINCPARVNAITRDNEVWQVSKTISEHNHELQPDMSILMPTHRNLTINMKRQLEANDIAGIRPCKNVRMLEVQAGGPQNLGCLPKNCRNFIKSRRRLRLGDGDAKAIRKLFVRMQQKDGDFFHLMNVNDEGMLTNVLWVHPRVKAAYEEFHVVVSFDTTYLVNRYRMPFATIDGDQNLEIGGMPILDPNVTRGRGRPRSNRYKSSREVNQNKGRISTRGGRGARGSNDDEIEGQ